MQSPAATLVGLLRERETISSTESIEDGLLTLDGNDTEQPLPLRMAHDDGNDADSVCSEDDAPASAQVRNEPRQPVGVRTIRRKSRAP